MAKEHKFSFKSKGMYLETVTLFTNVYQGKGLVIKLYRGLLCTDTCLHGFSFYISIFEEYNF